jgi:hypothetical protein
MDNTIHVQSSEDRIVKRGTLNLLIHLGPSKSGRKATLSGRVLSFHVDARMQDLWKKLEARFMFRMSTSTVYIEDVYI